jgi:hypothetical protein
MMIAVIRKGRGLFFAFSIKHGYLSRTHSERLRLFLGSPPSGVGAAPFVFEGAGLELSQARICMPAFLLSSAQSQIHHPQHGASVIAIAAMDCRFRSHAQPDYGTSRRFAKIDRHSIHR